MGLAIAMDTDWKKWAVALLFVVLGAAAVWLQLERPVTGIDDADIFFVYARNLAGGHGFVYNIGGERVEGFTSLLWTLVCSIGFLLFNSIELFLLVLNVLLGSVVVRLCLTRTQRPWLFLILLAAAPAWFAWCQVTLMESGLWCLLVTAAILATVERRGGWLAVLLPLMVATRPESMLWGVWLLAVLFLSADKGRRIRSVLLPAGAFGLALVLLVGFRLSYFGYPVPNTYYAKVSPHFLANIRHGLGYFLGYMVSTPAVTVVLVVLAMVPAFCKERFSAPVRTVLCLLPGLGIPVLVGGDHFGAFRFYQPIWPLLCLLAANHWPENKRRLWKFVPLVLLVIGWAIFPFTARLSHEFRIARDGRATGEALNTMFADLAELPAISAITAGGYKYGYDGVLLDVLGLNSTEMGHAPGERKGIKNHASFNRDVFYRWQPDIFLPGDSLEFDDLVLRGLYDEPRFKALYEAKTLTRNGATVSAYFSRHFLESLGGAFAVE